MIRGAPLQFAGVCLVAAIVLGICWYGVFSTALSLQRDTISAYKEKLESINSAIKGSSAQPFQIVLYTNNPTAEKLTPANTNQPGFAYSEDGDKPLYTWSVKAQCWK